ncbi:MAG: T9SS type A sorting domain-containing protein [Ignavibacterium sp.]|nr:T9SS type A sorting domain-containing protein [Ignavibacterium sp.]MDW8375759.1 T9SS type A sorting domain-containing protein [Ignavibacteriales bacterium]
MKKSFILFSLSIFCLICKLSYAQDILPEDSKIWSKVEIDPKSVPLVGSSNYKYIPAEPIIRKFNVDGLDVVVYPNYRVRPTTNTTQSELSIDIHPTNNSVLFAGANTTNWPVTTLYGTGVYWTLNGGTTWSGTDQPSFTNSGDPANVIGTNGYFYIGYISSSSGQGIARSTNNGLNWTTYTVAPNPGSLADKNHLAIDKKVGSPFENRLYATWTDFGGTNNNQAVVRYSTNFGETWSSSINLSSTLSPGSHAQGVNVQTGPNGEVYVAFAIYDNWPGGEDAIGFAKSTDGGVTWTRSRIYGALTPNGNINFGIRGNLKPTNIRVASFPSMAVDRSGGPTNGYIYITWPQRSVAPAGSDPDIVMIRSTDGGNTWSAPKRVNDDPLNNGKDQYYPWCTVDQSNGYVYVVFYDNRETTNDSTGVYMAVSYDGAQSFVNFRVSDKNFRPKPITGLSSGYQGDYIGIAGGGGKAYPFWMDDRTGVYQAWITEVVLGPPCPAQSASNPFPADGSSSVSVNIPQLTWSNGAGVTQVEVWFGEGANISQIYNGPAISSINPPVSLGYNKVYSWKVVAKNDTCSAPAPVWSFKTELSPGTVLLEPFQNLNNWTPAGPLGLTNWTVQNTNNATGLSSPELRLSWTPQFNGQSYLRSTPINVPPNQEMTLEFRHFFDWYANPSGTIGVAVTYDNGATYTTIWQIVNPTANVGPATVTTNFVANSTPLRIAFFFNGNSFNFDYWYIDDVILSYIIPVELTSFTAKAYDDKVELNWTTATEKNNLGFEIQRSSGDEFKAIGFIDGKGTTLQQNNYSFIDMDVKSGNYKYRLKQIDFDGKFEFSKEIEVEVNPVLIYSLEQNYPNPFNPSTLIKYSIAEDGLVKISLYNSLGEKVSTLLNKYHTAGRHQIEFNSNGFSSGVYFYSIEVNGYKSVRKMIIMK